MNKVILITGSSSGFGKLTAQTLANEGHIVYASMRDTKSKNVAKANQLRDWAKKNEVQLRVLDLDVSDRKSISNAVHNVLDAEGHIDVVINNAGVGSLGLTEDFKPELVQRLFETNVFGVFELTRQIIPSMKKARRGLIITISSGMGRLVFPLLSVYSACKFAIEALAEGWRYELAPLGIDSIIVEPGIYPTTNFVENAYSSSPENSGNIKDYGKLKEFLDGYMNSVQETVKNGTANDPQDVANTISCLVNLQYGSRPLRTVVDKMMNATLKNLNKTTDEIEASMLHAYHLS